MAATTRRSYRLDRLERIIQTQSLLVRADLDLESFMQLIVDRLQEVTQARGAIIEFADGDDMVCRLASAAAARHIGLRIATATSLSGVCVRTASVLCCDDAETDMRVDRAACRRVGIRSMICTPLFQSGAAVGVLKAFSDRVHAFDGGDAQTLELMAGAIAAALDKQKALDARSEAETRLRSSEARMRTMLEHANDAIVAVDEAGRVSLWNCAAERLFGWAAAEAIGRPAADLIVPPALRSEFARAVAALAASDRLDDAQRRVTIQAIDRSGQELSVEISLTATRIDGRWELSAFGHDVSERRRLEARLREMALCDGLTGLANRRGFMETLDKAVCRAQRAGQPMALLFLDLDRFKEINDRFGHHAGDVALQAFARRLELCVRKGDTIARLGGDEFTVLAEGVASIDQAQAIVDKIVDALEPPLDATGVRLHASIGVSLYRAPSDASQFLREADRAMYRDKRRRVALQAFATSHAIAAGFVDDDPGADEVRLSEAG
jgi:diguanylate cyclase (GGDEF)-like protein/PAS domain S-box-containing protein